MKKTVITALVAVTAVAALSACDLESSNAAGKAGHHAVGSKAGAKAKPDKSKKAAPSYTVAQENAIESAKSYLDFSGFSRAGLIQQLSSKAGDQFTVAQATYAANHVGL
jgi:hypothetical protein